jgi:chemotaxis-related protein WspD
MKPIASTVKPGDPACWRAIGVRGDRSCSELVEHIHCRNCPRFAEAAQSLLDREQTEFLVGDAAYDTQAIAHAQDRQQRRSLLVFALGTELFALDQKWVAEISHVQTATRIAHRTTGLLEGVVNVRGDLYLRLALDRLLHVQGAAASLAAGTSGGKVSSRNSPRLIIVRDRNAPETPLSLATNGNAWTFAATHVLGLEEVNASRFEAPPAAMPKPLDTLIEAFVARSSDASASSANFAGPSNGRISVLRGAALLEAFNNAVY